jgi:hypothetical protein
MNMRFNDPLVVSVRMLEGRRNWLFSSTLAVSQSSTNRHMFEAWELVENAKVLQNLINMTDDFLL